MSEKKTPLLDKLIQAWEKIPEEKRLELMRTGIDAFMASGLIPSLDDAKDEIVVTQFDEDGEDQ